MESGGDPNLGGSSSSETLGDVISSSRSSDKTPSQSNRTLVDIIAHDPYSTKHSNKTWKTFKHKIRRNSGPAWTSSVHIPASDVPIRNNSARRMLSRQNSDRLNSEAPTPDSTDPESPPPPSDPTSEGETRAEPIPAPTARAMMLRRESSRINPTTFPASQKAAAGVPKPAAEEEEKEKEDDEEGEEEEEEEDDEEGEKGKPAVKMSLMALLAETDRELGLDGASYMMDNDEEDEDEEEEEEGVESGGGEDSTCCVCMVRHKGAGSVPCGHAYCRMCSRELYVQKSYCPLCNGFLMEILHVF